MKIINQDIAATRVSLNIEATPEDLEHFKSHSAQTLAGSLNIPGFRAGKAPTDLVLKHANQEALNTEFLNHGVNDLYQQFVDTSNLRVVGEPKITVTKFVPFSQLEISIDVPIVQEIKLPDYKDFKLKKDVVKVTEELIDQNIHELQRRSANKKPQKRPAKMGDLVIIDFEGSDFKTKEVLPMASAGGFRLTLGDKTFIPGFEDKIVGMTTGKTKTFTLKFPNDYHDKTFASRQVVFKVALKEVDSLELPKLDDTFAGSLGPFKNMDELTAQIKKELQIELERQATINLENRILDQLAQKTEVELDKELIDVETGSLIADAKQSALNRGQTWSEFLASRGQSEKDFEAEAGKVALTRIKGGLAIGEIATKEGLTVTDKELEQAITALKRQYNDPAMQQELERPAGKREIGMRLLTEKVVKLIENATEA